MPKQVNPTSNPLPQAPQAKIITNHAAFDFIKLPQEIRDIIYRYVVVPPTFKIKRLSTPTSSTAVWKPNILFASKDVYSHVKKVIFQDVTYTNDPVYLSDQIQITQHLYHATQFRNISLRIRLVKEDIIGDPPRLEGFVQQLASDLSHRQDMSEVNLKLEFSASLSSICTFEHLLNHVYVNQMDADPFASPPGLDIEDAVRKLFSAWIRAQTLAAIERVRLTLQRLSFKVNFTTNADSDLSTYAVVVKRVSEDLVLIKIPRIHLQGQMVQIGRYGKAKLIARFISVYDDSDLVVGYV